MEPTSRRIKELEVMVADVIVETPDTTGPAETLASAFKAAVAELGKK